MNGPDVRWAGVPHQTIVDWVSNGPGAALTANMEGRLKSTAKALDEASDLVSSALERAGGEWQGTAADAATDAMRALRNFTDGMFFTCNTAGIHAFSQSDGAGFVRANVPPVVPVEPPKLTGGLLDVVGSTIDFQQQQAAAKQAEQRAREIMEQYSAATRDRVAAMTPLTPAPQVVLTTASTTAGPPPVVGPPPRPHHPDPVVPHGNPPHGGEPVQPHAPAPGSPPAHTATPPPVTQSAQATGSESGSAPPAAQGALEAGAPGSAGMPTVGPYNGKLGQDPGARIAAPGKEGAPATGRGPAGAAGTPGRAGTVRGGTAHATGSAPYGAGARREEDKERPAKYAMPSADHFEPADPALDPYRDGWFVAPEVIGDEDEDDQ